MSEPTDEAKQAAMRAAERIDDEIKAWWQPDETKQAALRAAEKCWRDEALYLQVPESCQAYKKRVLTRWAEIIDQEMRQPEILAVYQAARDLVAERGPHYWDLLVNALKAVQLQQTADIGPSDVITIDSAKSQKEKDLNDSG